MYKMIAADIDGTLLNDKSEMSERTKTAITRVVGSGALFVVATGRAMRGITAKDFSVLFEEDMPFIVINGASLVMGKSRRVLFNKYLSSDLVEEIFELGSDFGVPMVIRSSEGIWANRECEATNGYFALYKSDMRVIHDIGKLRNENIFKVIWFDTPSSITRLQRDMNDYFMGRLNCHSSMPVFLEFVSVDANKGSALAEVGRLYGVDRSETIAVGDGFNDISMLKYAGLGVAMENAPDEVKAVCDFVTLSNNEDGAAAAIEKFMLKSGVIAPR